MPQEPLRILCDHRFDVRMCYFGSDSDHLLLGHYAPFPDGRQQVVLRPKRGQTVRPYATESEVEPMGMRDVRLSGGLSQESIGFLGGVDKSSISRHERGALTLDPKIIVMIARALRVRPTHLGGSS